MNPFFIKRLFIAVLPSNRWRDFAWALRLLGALAVSLAVVGAGWAQEGAQSAADGDRHRLILDQASWKDDSGQASFESARGQRYVPYAGIFSGGYTDAIHWIRLTVAPSTATSGLLISPPWLNEIALYDPVTSASPQIVGDRYPARRSAYPTLGHSFELAPAPAPREVWLRLKSTSAHVLDLELVPSSQIPRTLGRSIIWSGLHVSVLLVMFAVLLTSWWVQRDRVLGAYLLRHAAFTFYVSAYLGFPSFLLSDWLPPVIFDRGFSLCAVAVLPLGLRFDIAMLASYKPNIHLLRLLKLMGWLGLLLVALVLGGYERQALQANIYLLLISVLLVFLAALTCKPEAAVERLMSKRVLVGYHALISGGLLLGLAAVLGWIPPHGWTLQILIFHGMATASLMTILLVIRSQRQTQEYQRVNWALGMAQKSLELEQRRRQEESQFLHMLMHELKTPLSIISLALGARHKREENLVRADRAVQDMKAIIERCVHANQIADMKRGKRSESFDLREMVLQASDAVPGLQARLQLQAAGAAPLVADRQLVQIVVSNLLHNAVSYGDPVTPITVTLRAESREGREGVCMRVANTPGLAGWPDPELVFAKYYRAPGAQRESGSGLGLYLAQQLVAGQDGRLDYCPTDTQVQFELWIPQHLA